MSKFKENDLVIVTRKKSNVYGDLHHIPVLPCHIHKFNETQTINPYYTVYDKNYDYVGLFEEDELELYKEEFKVGTMNGMMGSEWDNCEEFPKVIQPIIINPTVKREDGWQVDKAMRFNEGRPKWSLVHYASLVPMIEVLEFGSKKYAPFNWQKPMDAKEILESMQRHLAALMDGETHDKESQLHHIGHIFANAMFYSYHNVIKK